jgi:hypothetical protein
VRAFILAIISLGWTVYGFLHMQHIADFWWMTSFVSALICYLLAFVWLYKNADRVESFVNWLFK